MEGTGQFIFSGIGCRSPQGKGPKEGLVGKVGVRGQEGMQSGTQQFGDERKPVVGWWPLSEQ